MHANSGSQRHCHHIKGIEVSRLYIRVMTGFYTHRKTMRLFAKIGQDAYWVPPRIWAYCAENQPDGDLSGYEAQELAMLLAYKGDATSMLIALKDCGFMDLNGVVHDWNEHNGYHKKFSDRAKTAAGARWSKERKEPKERSTETVERGKGKGEQAMLASEVSIATSMLVASPDPKKPASLPLSLVFDSWNELGIVPRCLIMSDKRRRILEARAARPIFPIKLGTSF